MTAPSAPPIQPMSLPSGAGAMPRRSPRASRNWGRIALIGVGLVVALAVIGYVVKPAGNSPNNTSNARNGVESILGAAIPGLTAADIKLNVQNRFGLVCSGPAAMDDGITYDCSGINPGHDILWRVTVLGDNPTTIRWVGATVRWYGDGNGEAAFDDFIGYIATLPYDGAQPDAARSWAQAQARATRAFGAADYELETASTGRERTLKIHGPVSSQ